MRERDNIMLQQRQTCIQRFILCETQFKDEFSIIFIISCLCFCITIIRKHCYKQSL